MGRRGGGGDVGCVKTPYSGGGSTALVELGAYRTQGLLLRDRGYFFALLTVRSR